MAGPRTLDLRPDAAELIGGIASVVRNGDRRRIRLSDIQPEVSIGGWISLEIGEEFSIEVVPPRARMARLAKQRTIKVTPTDPAALLELASLPFLEVTRPLMWEETHVVLAELLDAVRSAHSD